jgi:hypothetical protein
LGGGRCGAIVGCGMGYCRGVCVLDCRRFRREVKQ